MKSLKIYFTSDVHGSIYPTDYTNTAIRPMGLLAVNDSIQKDENTLIIDGGDLLQGSPFSSYIVDQNISPNPIADVMNEIGYDYFTLGNHDFNYGYNYLLDYLEEINAQCLCANVKITNDSYHLIQSSHIHQLDNGLRIGLIGITTDYVSLWEKEEHLAIFEITDPLIAAKEHMDSLKPDVDFIIGIYHGGFEKDIHNHNTQSMTTENIGYKICESLDFDLLLTGHQHLPIKNHTIHGTHIVQTPSKASQYASISIEFGDDHQLTDIASDLITPQPKPCGSLYKRYQTLEDQIQLWLDEPVGTLISPLKPKSHLDMALYGAPIANFLNQIQLAKSHAMISCTSLANQVMGLPTEVTLRDILSTYTYPNTLTVIEVTGKVLMKALEQSASYFTLSEDQDTISISESFLNPKPTHYNYDYFSGIFYEIDLRQPIGHRIVTATYQEQPINDNALYTVAMNNYRASGSGGYDFYKDCKVIDDIQIETSELVSDYIKTHPVVDIDLINCYLIIY